MNYTKDNSNIATTTNVGNQKTNKKAKKKLSWRILSIFIIFELIFTAITAPLIVFYGPFDNVKRTIVGAAMTTLSHQYIAKTFLSDAQINKILEGQTIEVIEQNENSDVKIGNKHDSNIERYEVQGKKFKGYMLIVHDPTRIKVGYTKKLGKEGQLTSQIAKDNNAVAAINAGGFTDKSADELWTGTGGQPTGLIIADGQVKYNDIKGEDEKRDTVAFTKKGLLLVGPHSLSDMKKLEVTEAVSFGPALVVNGQPTIKSGDGGWGIAPRTAIGQRNDGSVLLLVIDGRQVSSLGATLKEVQDVMLQYGAVNASNLDGGSSSTMYHAGAIVNNPSDSLGERAVPSVILVK
jgi:exopolysaccharide biosynthesis protein